MADKTLEGRTALVTGGSRNIGRAIALAYANAGANVIINTLQDKAAAEDVAAEVEATGAKAIVQVCDVADRNSVDAMVKAGTDAFGGVDILVCNASSRGMIDFLDMDYATWRRVIDISLDGTFHLAQATLPGMVANGWGRIITLGGISWHVGLKRRAHNLTGKAGLTGLTRALAAEFGDRGITVNSISPGHIDTVRPASAGARPPQSAASPTPVPRMGDVEEIASAALFLAEPKQGFITGQIIHVNGGLYMGT
jgi:3-oxoacyl-[acyl-carrier protein] reductase